MVLQEPTNGDESPEFASALLISAKHRVPMILPPPPLKVRVFVKRLCSGRNSPNCVRAQGVVFMRNLPAPSELSKQPLFNVKHPDNLWTVLPCLRWGFQEMFASARKYSPARKYSQNHFVQNYGGLNQRVATAFCEAYLRKGRIFR
ncbi:hypothetical protein TNCV_3780391 [Trichonephila clavipes]|nr:hypothetical protein TNCV_3780391 [Trichonephila clavipes]